MVAQVEVRLSDLVTIKHGYAFKGEFFRDRPPGDILLSPGNFAIGGGFQLGKLKYYDGPEASGFVLTPGDLLVTMTDLSKTADTLGYPAIVPSDGRRYLHNQRLGKVVLKDERASKSFIYWLLRTKPYRDEVLSSLTGSTVKHTSPSKIGAFKFTLPAAAEQDEICAILDAFDDKIELNQRMNETLEAMAQAIFRDWFVDFGPVRRKMDGATDPVAIMGGLTSDPACAAKLADLFPNALGDDGTPAGWTSLSVGELVVHCKGSVTPLARPDDVFEHYSLPAFDKGQEPAIDVGANIKSNKTPVPPGAVLLSKLNPEISRVWLPNVQTGREQIASTEFLIFQPREGVGRGLLYNLFRDPTVRQTLSGMVTGTSKSHQRISPPALLQTKLLVAGVEAMAAFEKFVEPMVRRGLNLRSESRTLAETRDYLLPRLMSGQVRVGGHQAMVA